MISSRSNLNKLTVIQVVGSFGLSVLNESSSRKKELQSNAYGLSYEAKSSLNTDYKAFLKINGGKS